MQDQLKEVKELLKFVIALGMGFDKAYADKKIGVEDLGLLVAPLMLAGPALENVNTVVATLKAATPEQLQELDAFVKVELKLENAKIEFIIEKAIDLALAIYEFVQLFKKAPVA